MTKTEMMDELCAFKVGDIVKMRANRYLEPLRDTPLMILQRRVDECSGSGVQVHYTVRCHLIEATTGTPQFGMKCADMINEIELEPWEKK